MVHGSDQGRTSAKHCRNRPRNAGRLGDDTEIQEIPEGDRFAFRDGHLPHKEFTLRVVVLDLKLAVDDRRLDRLLATADTGARVRTLGCFRLCHVNLMGGCALTTTKPAFSSSSGSMQNLMKRSSPSMRSSTLNQTSNSAPATFLCPLTQCPAFTCSSITLFTIRWLNFVRSKFLVSHSANRGRHRTSPRVSASVIFARSVPLAFHDVPCTIARVLRDFVGVTNQRTPSLLPCVFPREYTSYSKYDVRQVRPFRCEISLILHPPPASSLQTGRRCSSCFDCIKSYKPTAPPKIQPLSTIP